MSNKWSKEDKAVWEGSEVMQAFEKAVLDNVTRVEILAKKIAAITPDDNQVMQGMTASEKGEYIGAKNNPAEDGEYSEENNAADGEGDYSPHDTFSDLDSDTEGGVWDKEAMVLKLREITKNATDKGLYSLAYKIERTIDEIIEG